MKIKKKPIILDAWVIDTAELQYHGDVLLWVHEEYQANASRLSVVSDGKKMVLRIRTLEGVMTAEDGDVLVKGVHNELYSIKWDIFKKTYDVVDEQFDDTDHDHSFEVVSIEDLDDGSAIFKFDMDYDTMKIFAEIGLKKAIVEAAEKVVKENG